MVSSKIHFEEIDFVIYFPASGNANRDLKKYGVSYRDHFNNKSQSGSRINFEDVLDISRIKNRYPHTVGYFVDASGRGAKYKPKYIDKKTVSSEEELQSWIKEIGL